MATVTASDGLDYHLWGLPDLTTPEPEDSTEYARVRVELTDGFRSSIQTGFDTGTKRWVLTAPTLAGNDILPVTLTDVNGALTSRLDYVWSLYEYTQQSGTPFIIQDRQDSEYYFATFEDDTLTMQRMRVKIYSTGIKLIQVRIAGVYIP